MEIQTIYDITKNVLEQEPKTRDSDEYLYIQVCKNFNLAATAEPFYMVFCKRRELGLPAFESVSRCRRKLQSEFPQLRASEEVEDNRKRYEQIMFDFSIGVQ